MGCRFLQVSLGLRVDSSNSIPALKTFVVIRKATRQMHSYIVRLPPMLTATTPATCSSGPPGNPGMAKLPPVRGRPLPHPKPRRGTTASIEGRTNGVVHKLHQRDLRLQAKVP